MSHSQFLVKHALSMITGRVLRFCYHYADTLPGAGGHLLGKPCGDIGEESATLRCVLNSDLLMILRGLRKWKNK